MTGPMRVDRVVEILTNHVQHLGWSPRNWWGECLATDCKWTGRGPGEFIEAQQAFIQHLATVIVEEAKDA